MWGGKRARQARPVQARQQDFVPAVAAFVLTLIEDGRQMGETQEDGERAPIVRLRQWNGPLRNS